MSSQETHCPHCNHAWDYHAEDGCQAPIMISWLGPYDCNCQHKRPDGDKS